MIRCAKCGSELDEKARFCSLCGKRAPVNPQQPLLSRFTNGQYLVAAQGEDFCRLRKEFNSLNDEEAAHWLKAPHPAVLCWVIRVEFVEQTERKGTVQRAFNITPKELIRYRERARRGEIGRLQVRTHQRQMSMSDLRKLGVSVFLNEEDCAGIIG